MQRGDLKGEVPQGWGSRDTFAEVPQHTTIKPSNPLAQSSPLGARTCLHMDYGLGGEALSWVP